MGKGLLCIVLLVVAAANSFAQGVVDFSNVGTTADRHIYIGEYLTGSKPQQGEGYIITLWFGPSGTTDENAMTLLEPGTDFLPSPGEGRFNGGPRIIAASEVAPVLAFQARAWHQSMGATWAEAEANPGGRVGKGPIFEMPTGNPSNIFDPPPPVGSAPGWTGFAIAVPEPSIIALACLAAPVLLRLRRRGSSRCQARHMAPEAGALPPDLGATSGPGTRDHSSTRR